MGTVAAEAERRVDRRKRLLVLGAGPAQVGLLEAARARGDLEVIALDRDPAAPGFAVADRRAIISTEDERGIHRLAEAERVDGIMAPGIDWPVAIAARVAERLRAKGMADAHAEAVEPSLEDVFLDVVERSAR